MIRSLTCILCITAACVTNADWLTYRSTYTHDPNLGNRVAQYAPIANPTSATQPIRSSGFHHVRSTLNYGKSADNYHRVTKWGDPIEPYAAFRFPFRPYSTPYPNWGAPLIGSGTNIQLGGFAHPHGGHGFSPQFGPGAAMGNPGGFDPRGGGGLGENFGGQFAPGVVPRRPFSYQQPIGPLTPYPSLPQNVDRTSPLYDGYYPTYRD